MSARRPDPSVDDDEEELLESIETLSPLTALDPDQVDKLTLRQQAFLIEFIHTGSIALSRKKASVKPKDWADWSKDDDFQKIFLIVKSPLLFALNLRQAIQWRAGLKLFALLDHERVSVQQWAIERAFAMGPISGSEGPEKPGANGILTQADAKKLADQVVAQLEEAKEASPLNAGPFIQTKHTVIDSVPEVSNTGSEPE